MLFRRATAFSCAYAVLIALAFVSQATAISSPATAAVTKLVDFEGIVSATGFQDPIPQGYDGLNWTNIAAIGKDFLPSLGIPNSGYTNVVNSGVAAGDAYGNPAFGGPSSFSSSTAFDLLSGYFAAAWNNDLSITLLAYDRSAQVGSAMIVVNPTKSFIDFQNETSVGAVSASFSGRFTNIDEVSIEGSGGTNAGLGAAGTNVAMDDLLLAIPVSAVPEPSSLALLGVGMIGLGLFRWRGRSYLR